MDRLEVVDAPPSALGQSCGPRLRLGRDADDDEHAGRGQRSSPRPGRRTRRGRCRSASDPGWHAGCRPRSPRRGRGRPRSGSPGSMPRTTGRGRRTAPPMGWPAWRCPWVARRRWRGPTTDGPSSRRTATWWTRGIAAGDQPKAMAASAAGRNSTTARSNWWSAGSSSLASRASAPIATRVIAAQRTSASGPVAQPHRRRVTRMSTLRQVGPQARSSDRVRSAGSSACRPGVLVIRTTLRGASARGE